MMYRSLARNGLLLVCLAGAMDAPASAERIEADVSAIKDLIGRYSKSVDAADTKLASTIWANTADVSMIHPRGHEHGWEMIRTNLYEKAMRDPFSERKLVVEDVAVHAYGDAAWAEFNWRFAAKLRKDGTTVTTRGRETQIYRRRDGRWSLVHVHYSAVPVTEERRGF